MPLAHSENAAKKMHDLREHLDEVARIAAGFAAPFGSADWARAAGLWHDLGKNAADFQARLKAGKDAHKDDDADENKSVPGRVEHAIAGAIHATNSWDPELAAVITPVIAGHHAGLPDSAKHATDLGLPAKRARLAAAERGSGAVILPADPPAFPAHIASPKDLPEVPPHADAEFDRRLELWVRMLFSCLVDADWLDTAVHFAGGNPDAERKESIRGGTIASADLLAKLDAHMARLAQSAATPAVPAVNRVRAQVLADCRERGRDCPPGVFTLTAPTGSGKTLAGMAFALEHAVAHKLKRVIVVLPFTSIIDQNAKVYRDVFGAENVVDHHASLDPKTETDRNRVACENWDAPVVVTTSVQFLESLLANRPAKCRKLHNVCESVVIFDEVQTLPVGHLNPVLDVLKELVRAYKVSLVLSTATQPALKYRVLPDRKVFAGFENMTEIVRDVPGAFKNLARVRVEWPSNSPPPAGKMTDDDRLALWGRLAADVGKLDRVLVVTHARRDCRELAELLPDAVHLSALMCPKHRLKVLGDSRPQTGWRVQVFRDHPLRPEFRARTPGRPAGSSSFA